MDKDSVTASRSESYRDPCAEARAGDVAALRKFLAESPSRVGMATRLCHAAPYGHVQYIKLLLEHRASPNVHDGLGRDPHIQRNALHEACMWKEGGPVIALLLDHNADVNATARLNSEMMNAYEMALHTGNSVAVRTVERFVARDLPDGCDQENALHWRRPQNQGTPSAEQKESQSPRGNASQRSQEEVQTTGSHVDKFFIGPKGRSKLYCYKRTQRIHNGVPAYESRHPDSGAHLWL